MKVQDLINQLEKVIITSGNLDVKVGVYGCYGIGSIINVDHINVDENDDECVIII